MFTRKSLPKRHIVVKTRRPATRIVRVAMSPTLPTASAFEDPFVTFLRDDANKAVRTALTKNGSTKQ